MKERLSEETIAMRAAKEFEDGDYVNLGVGIPNLCVLFIPEGKTVYFHSENGVVGYGPVLGQDELDRADFNLVDAGGHFVTPQPGMCIVDHCASFAMVRGGHIDITVLGGMQVSEKGDLANWSTGDLASGGVGGAFDMPVGAKKTIITMLHTTKDGQARVMKKCSYPLTAKEAVGLIVTDIAVIEVTGKGLVLKEIAPDWTAEEVQALTEPRLIIAKDLKVIEL